VRYINWRDSKRCEYRLRCGRVLQLQGAVAGLWHRSSCQRLQRQSTGQLLPCCFTEFIDISWHCAAMLLRCFYSVSQRVMMCCCCLWTLWRRLLSVPQQRRVCFTASRISCNCHIGMQQSIQSDSRSNQLFNQLLVEEGTQNRIGVIR